MEHSSNFLLQKCTLLQTYLLPSNETRSCTVGIYYCWYILLQRHSPVLSTRCLPPRGWLVWTLGLWSSCWVQPWGSPVRRREAESGVKAVIALLPVCLVVLLEQAVLSPSLLSFCTLSLLCSSQKGAVATSLLPAMSGYCTQLLLSCSLPKSS